jgi:hypothetical protein
LPALQTNETAKGGDLSEAFFLNILILEVGTDTLPRNVSDKPSHAVQQTRRAVTQLDRDESLMYHLYPLFNKN